MQARHKVSDGNDPHTIPTIPDQNQHDPHTIPHMNTTIPETFATPCLLLFEGVACSPARAVVHLRVGKGVGRRWAVAGRPGSVFADSLRDWSSSGSETRNCRILVPGCACLAAPPSVSPRPFSIFRHQGPQNAGHSAFFHIGITRMHNVQYFSFSA